MSIVLELGDGIERSGNIGAHCAHPVAGAQNNGGKAGGSAIHVEGRRAIHSPAGQAHAVSAAAKRKGGRRGETSFPSAYKRICRASSTEQPRSRRLTAECRSTSWLAASTIAASGWYPARSSASW